MVGVLITDSNTYLKTYNRPHNLQKNAEEMNKNTKKKNCRQMNIHNAKFV